MNLYHDGHISHSNERGMLKTVISFFKVPLMLIGTDCTWLPVLETLDQGKLLNAGPMMLHI